MVNASRGCRRNEGVRGLVGGAKNLWLGRSVRDEQVKAPRIDDLADMSRNMLRPYADRT
jgi:hypothetical protein